MKCKVIEESRFRKMENMEDIKGGTTCDVLYSYKSCDIVSGTAIYMSCQVASYFGNTYYSGPCGGPLVVPTSYITCSGVMQYDMCIIGEHTNHISCSGGYNSTSH